MLMSNNRIYFSAGQASVSHWQWDREGTQPSQPIGSCRCPSPTRSSISSPAIYSNITRTPKTPRNNWAATLRARVTINILTVDLTRKMWRHHSCSRVPQLCRQVRRQLWGTKWTTTLTSKINWKISSWPKETLRKHQWFTYWIFRTETVSRATKLYRKEQLGSYWAKVATTNLMFHLETFSLQISAMMHPILSLITMVPIYTRETI